MKKMFIFAVASVAVSLMGAEYDYEDVSEYAVSIAPGSNIKYVEKLKRTTYNEEDIANKKMLMKSEEVSITVDKTSFNPKITSTDYIVSTTFNPEKLSVEEIVAVFTSDSISVEKIDLIIDSQTKILEYFANNKIELSVEKVGMILDSQIKMIDYLIKNNVKFNANKILDNIATILFQSDCMTSEQLQLVFEKCDKIFENFDVNNIEYSKLSEENIAKSLSIRVATKLPDVDKKANELMAIRTGDENVQWVIKNINDVYLYRSTEFVHFDSKLWSLWRKVFESDPQPVEKIGYEVPANGRFMFEVWTPENEEQKTNLFRELEFVKSRGYIGVVVMWDGQSDYKKTVEIQKSILSLGLKVWLGFSPGLNKPELSVSSFVEPVYYKEGLKALAVNAEAFLMGWRRTSMHLNIQNSQWQNYTMQALRSGNPKIGFIGEYYFGENGTKTYYTYHAFANYRKNYDAVLVVNYGYLSVNPKWALSTVRKTIGKDVQLVCLIQGPGAGYLTNRPAGTRARTREQYRRINELLEKRFLRAGFNAVMGMMGDGLNKPGTEDDMRFSKNRLPSESKF